MPLLWRIGFLVLIVCLVASIAIAIVQLTTAKTEIVGENFHGLHTQPGQSRQGAR